MFDMKRLFLLAMSALLIGAPLANAQTKVVVNKEATEKKVAKSDLDIANPKKNTKAAVWLERGKVFSDAASEPSGGMYGGMEEIALKLLYGEPKTVGEKKLSDGVLAEYVYPYLSAYVKDGKVVFFDITEEVIPGAAEKAYEAYDKAYQVDPASAAKVAEGLRKLSNYYAEKAGNKYGLEDYKASAECFRKAYEVKKHPAVNEIDTASLFNAGFLATFAGDFQQGLDMLNGALAIGYDFDGDTYYYLFHCYYGLKQFDKSKNALEEGLKKHPKNNKLVEGLVSFYSTTEGYNPEEVIPVVKSAVENDPKNAELWSGLGRVYDKLNMPEEAVGAFSTAAELAPEDFGTNFNLGLLYIKVGDMYNEKAGSAASIEESNEMINKRIEAYAASIAPLEKAHSLNPTEKSTVELLKNVCFSLRDAKEGMLEKSNKYKALLEQL